MLKRRKRFVDSYQPSYGEPFHLRKKQKISTERNGDRFKEEKSLMWKPEDDSTSGAITEPRILFQGHVGEFSQHVESPWHNSRAINPERCRQSQNKFSRKEKMKNKKLFYNKIKEKKDYDVPQRMNWMIEFSEKDGIDIVAKLANSHSCFENMIKDAALLQKKPDIIVLIMKMLHKVGEADFKETKASVLSKACNQEFLEQLKSFMMKLPTNEYKNEAFNVNNFLTDVLKFSESIITLMPTFATEKFNGILYMVHMTFVGMEAYANVTIRDEVKELHQRLQKLLAKSTEENKEKKVKLTSKAELQSLEAPPNNFRNINLIPTSDDIFAKEHVFVRPNLIRGAYTSVEHYLDVHFRLLHEDFLNPMREGINEFVKKVETQKIRKNKPITNVRFYPNVVFLRPKVVNDRIGITVNFDIKKFKNINWRTSKRFMYGSLLCFTQDNFRTFFFGTIIEREEKDLQNGMLVVELCVGSQIRDDLFTKRYAMAESEVLKALRTMTENDFPMKRYVVEAQSEGHAPAYLLTDPPAKYIIESDLEEIEFPILSPELWPSVEQLGLDDSQYKAFKFALTREFVVVQGPPGTGKTFLVLKVTGVLLKNKQIWNADKKPIFVVCYTNHALDQFMEGLLKYTNQLVRAGGTVESVESPYIQDTVKLDIIQSSHTKSPPEGRDIHKDMERSARTIKSIQLNLEEINKIEGIISLELLYEKGVIDESCYYFFDDGFFENKEQAFVEWLLPENENVNFTENIIENDERNMDFDYEYDDDDDDDDDDDFNHNREELEGYDFQIEVKSTLKYAVCVKSLNHMQKLVEHDITELEKNKYTINYNTYCSISSHLNRQRHDIISKRSRLLQRSKERNIVKDSDIKRVQARPIQNLYLQERWILYRYWLSQLKDSYLKQFKELEETFNNDAKKYEEARLMIDLEIMKNASVLSRQYELLKNVHITVVDNFQGEESDIILLSLVRSNEEGNIGFLKIENRVCVALSRARKGMYIMGNMKNLTENSDIWPKINETLQQQQSIGKELELQCQASRYLLIIEYGIRYSIMPVVSKIAGSNPVEVHPTEKRLVSSAEDFRDIPEGGCKLICESLLTCGHICKKMCHANDRDHKNYRCPEIPCNKVKVKKETPDCKHENEMQCWNDPSKFPCSVPCAYRLDDCGHTCRLKCHVNRDPDHLDMKLECCKQPERSMCSKPCKRKLSCGHKCKLKCGKTCEINCKEFVESSMVAECGHVVKLPCYKKTAGVQLRVHFPEKCNWICEHYKCTKRCSEPCNRPPCERPCKKKLKCRHPCIGFCGEPCPKLCRICNKDEVTTIVLGSEDEDDAR
ncbi:hypothetical protein C0J52_05534 [Blattella germanica]|nr:hypothetical protein C0J52_05534 [Blattella germanica]